MKIKRILVATDFSSFSDEAVSYAFRLAERFKARVSLFHSVVLFQSEPDNRTFVRDYEQFVHLQEEDSRNMMTTFRTEAERRGLKVDFEVRRGFSAADDILSYAEEMKADIIVMGSHGRTGFKRWFYGSVSERVMRLSATPVLIVHSTPGSLDKGSILVPVDFSENAKLVARNAIELAHQFNASLVFLHVVEIQVHPAFYTVHVQSPFIIDGDLKKRVLERMREFVAYSGDDATFLVQEGRPWNEIVEYAEENNISLIAMGTRGLTGMDHFLLGSTAERVARFTNKPVLSIRLAAEEGKVDPKKAAKSAVHPETV